MSDGQSFQNTFHNRDQVLEAFENIWDRGDVPDFSASVDELRINCSHGELTDAVSDLIQIDMERRWRAKDEGLRLSLQHYLEIFPALRDKDSLVEIICWEYRVRSQWGDCILRHHLCQQYPEFGERLFVRLDEVAAGIVWPKVEFISHGFSPLEVQLDRPVEAGRQRSVDPKPRSVTSTRFAHRIVMCESTDPSLSRQQLRLTLHSADTVLVQNISANRAVEIRDACAVDAGQSLICQFPVYVHFGASRYLRAGRF
jgi:hypothetical protein